jgi:hypothetical protein
MRRVPIALLAGLTSTPWTRASLHVEILALRYRLGVLQSAERRGLGLWAADRVSPGLHFRFLTGWRASATGIWTVPCENLCEKIIPKCAKTAHCMETGSLCISTTYGK